MRKLTLTEWANIAEVVGAIAVVASLLYVGYEIQRNTKVGLASNRQAIADRAQELALYSGEIGIDRLIFDANGDNVELTEAEQRRFTAYVGALLRTTEEAYLLYRDGLLDEEYWNTRAGVMLAVLRSRRARGFYIQTKEAGFYTGDFVVWVDKALLDKVGP